jgi:hypothetical protein
VDEGIKLEMKYAKKKKLRWNDPEQMVLVTYWKTSRREERGGKKL